MNKKTNSVLTLKQHTNTLKEQLDYNIAQGEKGGKLNLPGIVLKDFKRKSNIYEQILKLIDQL